MAVISAFDNIPTEILIDIFKKLPKEQLRKIASVCKKWNEILNKDVLWKDTILPLKITLIEGKVKSQLNAYFHSAADMNECKKKVQSFFGKAKKDELCALHCSFVQNKKAHLFALLKIGTYTFPSDVLFELCSSSHSCEKSMNETLSNATHKLALINKENAIVSTPVLSRSKLDVYTPLVGEAVDIVYNKVTVFYNTGKSVYLNCDNQGKPGFFNTSIGARPPKTMCVYSFNVDSGFFNFVKKTLEKL